MTINIEKDNGTETIIIDGRMDTTTAPLLEQTINDMTEEVKDLVLDMNKLVYISSAACVCCWVRRRR